MTEGKFGGGGCGKLHVLDSLFFLGCIPYLELRLVRKLSVVIIVVVMDRIKPPTPEQVISGVASTLISALDFGRAAHSLQSGL